MALWRIFFENISVQKQVVNILLSMRNLEIKHFFRDSQISFDHFYGLMSRP